MRPAVPAELLAHVFAAAITRKGAGRVESAADRGVRFVWEEGLGVAVVPGQGDAEPGCEGCCLGAACEGVSELVLLLSCDRVRLGDIVSFLVQGGGSERTVRAAVVEEDVCLRVGLVLVLSVGLRDCDFVLVALAGA